MAIVRYNTWNEFAALDRLMGNAFGVANGHAASSAPAIDIAETPQNYTVKAALPGWKPEDVDVTFENGTVTLKGAAKEEKPAGEVVAKYHQREIRKMSFARTVSFPVEVEADKANAEFENGVLTLTLPKAEMVQPKQIKIAVK